MVCALTWALSVSQKMPVQSISSDSSCQSIVLSGLSSLAAFCWEIGLRNGLIDLRNA